MNEKVKAMFAGRPLEQQFIALALSEILGEDKVNTIADTLEPSSVTGREDVAGRPLRFYSGLSREQLKGLGVSDENIDEAYKQLGVEESGDAASADPNRAATAPEETADLESVPTEATPAGQAERLVTESDPNREETGKKTRKAKSSE